jgi:glycosyltransferase involved in cell wall biosynthesis
MISFGITTKNEGVYIQDLFNQIIPYCESTGDEIVVVDDFSDDEYTRSILDANNALGNIKLHQHALNGDFATHKNFLLEQCVGDFIVQIDADETLHPNLLTYLHDLVDNNDIDLFLVPRVNVVTGLTDEDIQRWGWSVNDKGWVMFPDYQSRIMRNHKDIRWEGKVHERITGHKTQAPLPAEEAWSLYHIKDIDRQRRQNALYQTITRD